MDVESAKTKYPNTKFIFKCFSFLSLFINFVRSAST